MLLRILISALLVYLIVYMIVPYLRRLALNLDWLDVANSERKVHTDSIPLVGGPAMAIGILIVMLVNLPGRPFATELLSTVLGGGGVLLITGIVDDKVDLRPLIKLAIQACCAYSLCIRGFYFDGVFEMIGMGGMPVYVQQALTFLFIIGVVNAYNLIDGIDGLAGTLFLAGFGWMGGAALFLGHLDIALLCALSLAAVLAFLKYNTSSINKIFMGDGGSLFLGFLLAGASISLLERGSADVQAPFWLIGTCAVLALPILDELRVFAERMAAGKSPLYADNSHIHHILMQIDPTHRLVRNWILKIVFVVFLLAMVASYAMGMWGGVATILVCLFGLFALLQMQRTMHQQREELRILERRKSAAASGK
ncbi:MraY family glycosyltransferase [Lewinella sp. IMCC34191]|uniref:MraY family glycosyltransferase n=1 Tax=Lewinella sp. IMCC34191 TaxID=2259172 RepID=UPI000E27C858|nr:MraY family glycosyltransferase [Lewinella sp. IMCC34191]